MVPYLECASAKPNPSSVKCELFGQLYSSLHRVCSGPLATAVDVRID